MTEKKLPSDYLEQGWCQGSYAVDGNSVPVTPTDSSAVCWCLVGAGMAAFGNEDDEGYRSGDPNWTPTVEMTLYGRSLVAVLHEKYKYKSRSVSLANDKALPAGEAGQRIAIEVAREAEIRAGLR